MTLLYLLSYRPMVGRTRFELVTHGSKSEVTVICTAAFYRIREQMDKSDSGFSALTAKISVSGFEPDRK